MRTRIYTLSLTAFAVACASKSPPPDPNPTPAPVATATQAAPPPKAEPAPPPPPPPPPPAPTPPTAAVRFGEGLSTPESVLYDAAGDRYLVSNINGTPLAADNNGYITVLSPDGKVVTPKWIEGGAKKVTLNAPKGLGIAKGVLYVADIDAVRMFDAKTGASKGEIKIAGATFLNDVAVSADGSKVYVSDTGVTMDATGFKPAGVDAVWIIEKGKARALAKTPDLGGPNGLLVDGASVWVVTFGTGLMYRLDEKGDKQDLVKPAKGMLDGIVKVGDNVLVSSWEGQGVMIGNLKDGMKALFEGLEAPADIGYDSKRNRLLVPRFMGNAVEAYDLPK